MMMQICKINYAILRLYYVIGRSLMSETTDNPEVKTGKMSIKQIILWIILAIIIATGLYGYILYRNYFPSTDDAYVQANVVDIAAEVSGPVSAIYVKNNQTVKKDQPLFDIDPRPFIDAVNEAKANLKLAKQQMQADVDSVEVATAQVNQAKAQLFVNAQNYRRVSDLVKTGNASIADGDNAKGAYDNSKAALVAAKKQLLQAEANLGDVGERNAQIQKARANLADAKLNVSYTKIVASADGYVTNFEVRKGTMVTAQQALFQLVENNQWWVYANFKETQMQRIEPDQTARIAVDMYPHYQFKGYVQSISRGSGSAFSLLPPENATGNWVKVTQRFPIKIVITNTSSKYPLRVGSSSTVTVNTRKTYQPEPAQTHE